MTSESSQLIGRQISGVPADCNCRCEKIANVKEKVNALENIVADHTKTSHSIQISHQSGTGNSHQVRRSLNKPSKVPSNQASKRTSEVVTITLDDSSDDDDDVTIT